MSDGKPNPFASLASNKNNIASIFENPPFQDLLFPMKKEEEKVPASQFNQTASENPKPS